MLENFAKVLEVKKFQKMSNFSNSGKAMKGARTKIKSVSQGANQVKGSMAVKTKAEGSDSTKKSDKSENRFSFLLKVS